MTPRVHIAVYRHLIIEGTTIPFHLALMDNEVFKSAQFNTKFLEENNVLNIEK